MSEATVLVVGVPIYEEKNMEKYNGKYKCRYEKEIQTNELQYYLAGYEHRENNSPKGIIGKMIIETWNDAIEITDKCQEKIEKAKKLVYRILGEKAGLWIIGHQT